MEVNLFKHVISTFRKYVHPGSKTNGLMCTLLRIKVKDEIKLKTFE